MAGLFDDLIPGAKPGAAGGLFADLIPAKPKTRNPAAVANDLVIEAGNAVAGGVKSVADFVAPGNAVSSFIEDNIIRPGEASQSDAVKFAKAKYAADMEAAGGIGDEIGATLGYAASNPGLALAQAAGSFVVPGAAVKGGGMLASLAGAGAKGASRAGLAGGAVAGAALSGGDAAGTAYELVMRAGGTEDQAAEAARKASVLPAAIGAAGGVIGAERLLAGAGGFKGGMLSRALKTAGVEGAQEAVEEGVTQYEGQRAAVPFDPTIDPLKGVAGAATMGAVLGGATGGAISLLSGDPGKAKKPGVADILGAPDLDKAIDFSLEAVTAPAKKEDKPLGLATGADGLPFEADPRFAGAPILRGGERPAAPVFGSKQQADIYIGEQALFQSHEAVETAPGQWQAQPTAATRALLGLDKPAPLPTPDARELSDEERQAYANKVPLSYSKALRNMPQPEVADSGLSPQEVGLLPTQSLDDEGNAIPTGEAQELYRLPRNLPVSVVDPNTPPAAPKDTIPAPAPRQPGPIPIGEATEFETLPVGEVLEGDLLARDGEPFTSKTGAQAKAYANGGGKVVAIPNHFGSGVPGYVVRQLMPGRPSNTRGTDARDLPRSSNDNQRELSGNAAVAVRPADGAGDQPGRSGGTVGRVADDGRARPLDAGLPTVAAGGNADQAAGPAIGDAGTALTTGARVTLAGTPYTVTSANNTAVRLQGADGGVKMVATNSKTFGQIERQAADGKRQAVAGGQTGINGYEYKGGQFLPSTMAEPGKWKVKGKWVNAGKEQIGPGEWSHQPTPFSRSIFSLIGGWLAKPDGGKIRLYEGADGKGIRDNTGAPLTRDTEIRPGVKGVLGKQALTVGELIDAYNNGQRWFDVQPDAETVTTQAPGEPAQRSADTNLKREPGSAALKHAADDAAQRERQQELIDRLNAYERDFVDRVDNRSQQPESAHNSALGMAGLTGDGLLKARGLAGLYPTMKPGVVVAYDGPLRDITGRRVDTKPQEPNEAARPQAQAAAGESAAPAAAPAPAAPAVVPGARAGAVEADGVKPTPGLRFFHSKVLDSDNKPMEYSVTRVANGVVYYAPVDGGKSEKTDVGEFARVVGRLSQPANPADEFKTRLEAGAKMLGMRPGAAPNSYVTDATSTSDGVKNTAAVRFVRDGDRLGGQITVTATKTDPATGREVSAAPADPRTIYGSVDEVLEAARKAIAGQGPWGTATSGEAAPAPAPEADDYLKELFGASSAEVAADPFAVLEREAAKGAEAQRADAKRIRDAIGGEKKRAQAEYDDWSSRTYKANKTQVELRGDGPSNQASMSIGGINESRRRNAMEALSQELKALDKLERGIADDAGAAQFMSAMRALYERAEKIAAGGNGLFKTPGEQFQYMLLDDLKFRGPAGKGNVTSNGLSKAVLAAVKPEAAPAERTPKAQAVKEALAPDLTTRKGMVKALKKLGYDATDLDAARTRIPNWGRVGVKLNTIPFKLDMVVELKNERWQFNALESEDPQSISQQEEIAKFKADFAKLIEPAKRAAQTFAPLPANMSNPAADLDTSAGRVQSPAVSEPVATHKDPGEPAEPVTPAVVREAIKTAAENEGRSRSAMKADALRLIDEAIAKAPEKGDKKITIKVPGDGTFTVVNNVARLREFRRQVELSPGFKDKQPRPAIGKANSSADYGPDQLAREMLEDGEPMNAVEVLEAAGKTMMFGNGGESRPIPYTNGEPVEIAGVADLFVGRGWSAKKGNTSWWAVIHKQSGFSMGGDASSKAEAIAAAKKLLGQPEKLDKLKALVASGKSADGKPFKSQDELRAEFMAWAERQQQSTFDEADATAARAKAMNDKEKERDAFYQSIMGDDMRRPQRADWTPAAVEELLNAAEKQGRAPEALTFMRDVVSNYADQSVDKWAQAYERRTKPTDTGWQTGFQAPGGYRRIRRDVTIPGGATYRAELDERAGAYVTGMVQKWSADNGRPQTLQTFSNDMDARQKADTFMDGLMAKAEPAAAPAPAADDRVLTIKSGGSTQTLTLPKPAWQATDDELVQAVKDSGTYLGKPGSKYDPYRQWREAHSEAITKAARDGKKFPDELLYDKPALIRTDLNDDQADEASDAMVAEYRATKDYGKAVAVYREWGKKPPTPAAQAPAGRDEQPESQAPAKPAPKSFRKSVKVKTAVFMEETSTFAEQEIDADTAIKALEADIAELQAFRNCIAGG